MSEFTPFPVPRLPGDTPLVYPSSVVMFGASMGVYRCSGCHEPMQQGCWMHETVETVDGVDMVTGLDAYAGQDGAMVHHCGADQPESPAWTRQGWAHDENELQRKRQGG